MRILFVGPPYNCWGVQVIGTWPPLQAAYLAGAVEKAGHEARIYDAMNKVGATFDDVRAEIERLRPDVVVTLDYLPVTGAISTATVPAALETLRIAKAVDPSIVTIIGGPHPTFMYQEIFADPANRVDYVLLGEDVVTDWRDKGATLAQLLRFARLRPAYLVLVQSTRAFWWWTTRRRWRGPWRRRWPASWPAGPAWWWPAPPRACRVPATSAGGRARGGPDAT